MRDRELVHREIVRRSPNPVFLVDASSGSIIEANPAAANLLGYPPDELIGLEFHRVDARGKGGVERLITQVAGHPHDVLGESVFVRRDGGRRPVELSGIWLIVDDRDVICFFARDLTDRAASREERDVLEMQLWFSQKHEAVGRLAGGIAHDFNNLLMAIMLNVDMVRDRLPAEHPSRSELGEIVEASERARELTRQLLAFSGRQVLEPRPVRLNQVVAGLERLLRRTIGEDIALEVDLSPDAGVVHVDPGQMEQVVLNLVVNARDAMPEGGRLQLITRNVDLDDEFCRGRTSARPGPHVMLRVHDTGRGMDPETQARIFEPFFTTKEHGAGSGLGLATVYGIVKQSGGNIWVDSRLGEGATFDVYLPRVTAEPAPPIAPEAAQPLEAFRGSETVLVVEDEPAVRKLVAGILKEQGYAVLEADAPAAALDLFDRLRASGGSLGLVIANMVMPGMTGPRLVERMREAGLAAPVLFISGHPRGMRPREGDGFMAKPFSRLRLVREVRRILDAVS